MKDRCRESSPVAFNSRTRMQTVWFFGPRRQPENGGSAYTGPLDLVPGAVVAYGVRALSAAWLGQPLFRLRRSYDDEEMTFNADPVTGDAPLSQIQEFGEEGVSLQQVLSATIVNGGSGYTPNSVVTVQVLGGTLEPGFEAYVDVNTDGAGVAVSVAGINYGGEYTVVPTNPASTNADPDPGTGLTLNLTTDYIYELYLVLWYDQVGDADMPGVDGDPTYDPLFVRNFLNGRPGFTHRTGNTKGNLETTGLSIALNGECSGIAFMSLGTEDGGSATGTEWYSEQDATHNATYEGQNAVQMFYNDGDNQARASHADVESHSGAVFDCGWKFGTRNAYINGTEIALVDGDQGVAPGNMTVGAYTVIYMGHGTSELIVYPTYIPPTQRLSGRENVAEYYGQVLP